MIKKTKHLNLKLIWPFNFFYIYIQIGPERRLKVNKQESKNVDFTEKRRHLGIAQAAFYYFLFSGICVLLGTFFLLSLYFFKNMLGINLLAHSHPVKDYFASLGLCP